MKHIINNVNHIKNNLDKCKKNRDIWLINKKSFEYSFAQYQDIFRGEKNLKGKLFLNSQDLERKKKNLAISARKYLLSHKILWDSFFCYYFEHIIALYGDELMHAGLREKNGHIHSVDIERFADIAARYFRKAFIIYAENYSSHNDNSKESSVSEISLMPEQEAVIDSQR
ncbi:hypothetical protein NZZ21_001463 [Escherichia albertii]|uniref:hypothetical protein n=1 Tax=Escherichia albertii TaxID=208962 RepID=UPI001386C45F|nr:hypothetical protein [Escherichia albertii]EJI9010431.1 hypothetical protein [Escherichia albertii]EJQ6145858.1 hypothetical protein [Escherichia albertii]MCZ9127440.1 hypothetical protein [Escherichia albertii]